MCSTPWLLSSFASPWGNLPGSTHMNEKSSRSHAVTWTPFLLGLVVWWVGRPGEDSEDGPTNHCEGFWLRLCCPQFCKVSFHDWEVRKIRHHFGKAIDMVFSVPGPWCFHASQSQGFRNMYCKEDQRWLYVSKKEGLQENCQKKTHDPETVVSKFRAHMRPSRRPFHHRWLCVCRTEMDTTWISHMAIQGVKTSMTRWPDDASHPTFFGHHDGPFPTDTECSAT